MIGGFYGSDGMPGNGGMGGYPYQGGSGAGYQAPSQGGAYYGPTSHAAGLGPVYYNVGGGGEGSHAGYERKSIGELTLNEFFGKVSDHLFTSNDYMSFAPLVSQLQLPLPVTSAGGAEYAAARHGGGVYGGHSHNAPELPSIPALRTRQDLLSVKAAIEEMTQAANNMGPGGPVRRHASSNPLAATSGVDASSTAAHAVGSPTPSLTPAGSSAVSNASGHSPASSHSHTVSPTTGNGMHLDTPTASTLPGMPGTHATTDTGYQDVAFMGSGAGNRGGYGSSMYPTISTTASAGMSAPVPTLGSSFDMGRRRSGGHLRSGNPARRSNRTGNDDHTDDTAVASPTAPTDVDLNIDPALSGSDLVGAQIRHPSSGSPTPTPDLPETLHAALGPESQWLETVRKLDQIRDLINRLIEHGVVDEDENEDGAKHSGHEDAAARIAGEGDAMEMDQVEQDDGSDSLYPKLNT